MATVTKTFTENFESSYRSTWTVSITGADQTATNDFQLTAPTVTAKYVYAGKKYGYVEIVTALKVGNSSGMSKLFGAHYKKGTTSGGALRGVAMTSGTSYSIPRVSDSEYTLTIPLYEIFTADNKTTKKVNVVAESYQYQVSLNSDAETNLVSEKGNSYYNTSKISWGTIGTVTLNAPPQVTLGTPTYATPHYNGYGAYTVPLTKLQAQYEGNITSAKLTVGNASTTKTYSTNTVSNDAISVVPTSAGTFTPTLIVTDSRGQTTTKSLSAITVNKYNVPSFEFGVFRCDNAGLRADEGAYGMATVKMNYTSAVVTLTEPAVTINDTSLDEWYSLTRDTQVVSGKTYYTRSALEPYTYTEVQNPVDADIGTYYETATVTWYSSYDTTNGVSEVISDWSSVADGSTVYGLIYGSFAVEQSYIIGMTETDSDGGISATLKQTLSTAFYTIDFKAGGKEIAFGAPAKEDLTNYPPTFDTSDKGLFKCDMTMVSTQMVGEIKMWAGNTVPIGWLECDGSELAKADYPLLYNAIKDLWGTPSDADHFVLPNLQGRVPVGQDTGDTSFNDVGETGGNKNIQAHTHGFTAPQYSATGGKVTDLTGTNSGGMSAHSSHTHQYGHIEVNRGTGSTKTRQGPYGWQTSGVTTIGSSSADLSHTHTINHGHGFTQPTISVKSGYGGSVNAVSGLPSGQTTGSSGNLQPYAVVKYIICAV